MTNRFIAQPALRFCGVLVLLITAICASAQTPAASLAGAIRDGGGQGLSNVKLTLRNNATGTNRSTLTDDEGRYHLANVDPGNYELRAEREGFSTEIRAGVVLSVGSSLVMDVVLHPGQAKEVVVATQKAPLIEPDKAELSRVVNEDSIASLPILGRNFVDFAKLSSGVGQGRENVGGGAFKEPDIGVGSAAAPRLTFGGQSELSTKILVDGADNSQTFTGLPRATPPQEAAQEFRIQNRPYLAEYGGSRSGFVNIVTKSGASNLHGSLYYYGMNNALNAQPILTGPNPALRQNQFGATLGGPVKQGQTFWFANYEGQRRAESNKFSQVLLNNLAAINQVKSFYGLAPEVSDLLRTNDYSSVLGKLDHKLSEANYLSFPWNLIDSHTTGFLGGDGRASPASSTARNNDTLDQSAVASYIAVRRHLVNELRLQWGRRSFDFPSVLKQPDLEVSNLILTGKSTSDMDFYQENRAQLADSLAINIADHQIKVGGDFNNLRDSSQWDLFFPARVIFPDLTSFFNHSPAVFWFPYLKNAPVHPGFALPFSQDVPAEWQPFTRTGLTHNSYGFFAQDEWRATSSLTLTYGLRYDFETYPGSLGLHADLNNWQPRAGFAWAFNKHGVVRGGFGIYNDRLVSSIGQTFDNVQWLSAGNQANAHFLFTGVAPINGRFIQPTVRGAAAGPATQAFLTTGQAPTLAVLPVGFTTSLDSNLRTPYTEQGSLKVSQEIGGVVISANYLYVHGLKIGSYTPMLNGVQTATLASGKPVFGARQFSELGDFFVIGSGGLSIYHGGTLEVEKRFKQGISFAGSYTFAKTISNTDSLANLADFPEGPGESERALSRQNIPQRFTLAFMSEIPRSTRILHNFKISSLL